MSAALCVKKIDVWKKLGFTLAHSTANVYNWNPALLDLNVQMVDRSLCETNPELLQLIPYILVTTPQPDVKVMTYQRGKGSGELRLADKLSIGFGGHIDRAPARHETLETLIRYEAARELYEELQVFADPFAFKFLGIVYDEETEVGKVHLGIVLHYELLRERLTQNLAIDKGEIAYAKALSHRELHNPEYFSKMELWSQAILCSLRSQITEAFGLPQKE